MKVQFCGSCGRDDGKPALRCRKAEKAHRVERVQNKGEDGRVEQRLKSGRLARLKSLELRLDFSGANQVRQDG